MLNYHEKLFWGKKAGAIKNRIKASLDDLMPFPEIYLITLAENPNEQLDIYDGKEFLFHGKRIAKLTIVGLALGKGEALSVVKEIATYVYRRDENGSIRELFEEN